jgi:chromosome transmission fidelity protein 4
LAWGDTEGNLYRWVDPIAQGHPGPAVEKASKVKDARGERDKSPGMGDMEEDFGEDVDEDWIIDDIGAAGATGLAVGGDSKGKEKSYAREIVSVTKAQPAFQPGATPLQNRKGYLAYNQLGVIEVTDQDSHQIVNVEFHDRSTYNSHHFTDHHNYTLASLGERGIAYAAHAQVASATSGTVKAPALVSYKPYAAWGSSTEWRMSLPVGEDVVAIAAGGIPTRRSYKNGGDDENAVDPEGAGNVVVATSTGYLRFFAGSGIQRYLWAMGGDVVSMVAGNEWVFVVHRQGGTSLDGECPQLPQRIATYDTLPLRVPEPTVLSHLS